MDDHTNLAIKIVSIISFLLISVAIILVAQNPSEGYELCIYSAVPVAVWVLILVAILNGTAMVVNQAATIGKKKNIYWWQIGIALILLSNLIIVLLPYLKGYAFACSGDHLTHIGYVKDISQTGTFASNNVYPIAHIMVFQLSSILGISIDVMINFIGPIFYLSFVLFVYLLSIEILPKTGSILSILAGSILYCYYYNQIFPMGFAFITTILVIYLYLKNSRCKSSAVAIILTIVGLLMVFFHPVTAFMLIVALLIMESGKLFFDKKCTNKEMATYQTNQLSVVLPILIFTALMLWIWEHFWVWNSSVYSVASWFNAELLSEPMTEKAAEAFGMLGLDSLDQLELLVKMYGHYIIYNGLSLAAVAAVARMCFISSGEDNWEIDHRELFLYSVLFLPVATIWLIDYARPLTTLSSGRIIWFVSALFPPLVGLTLYWILGTDTNKITKGVRDDSDSNMCKNARVFGVVLIVMACFVIGIFSIYPSPLTLRPNWSVSYAMVDGQEWLLENGDPNLKVLSLGGGLPRRYAHALWGTGTTRNYPSVDQNEQFPDHFNYHLGHTKFGESFEGDRYMILREKYIVRLYTELYVQVVRFNEDDLSKLNVDPSIDRVYTNEDMQVWYVH